MITALDNAHVEKDVENAYREAIHKIRPDASITSPYGTDGYAKWSTVRLLLETKYDLDFKARTPVCNTLGQCITYLKRFEQSGDPIPNVILVGDKNECFVLATASVKGFLDLPIDWSIAPSTGDPALTRALVNGLNILPYIYDVDEHFDFKDVIEKIEVLAKGEQHTVKANNTNIGAIFVYWRDRVFTGNDLSAIEQVDVFLKCLFHPTDVYLHPIKPGILVVPGYPKGVTVSTDQYRSFFNHFEQGYKPSEIESFYACKDRLVEDDARRRQGAFFTPDLWVAEAHKSLNKVLGSNWRDECIVWDPAAGTANLTRKYSFSNLIISTFENSDMTVIKDQGYNPGALIFQYDFLNPKESSPFFVDESVNEIPDVVRKRLKAAAQAGKRLVFFMNPPYGTAGIAGNKGTSKAGIAMTRVNKLMKQAKLGSPSQQLCAQFMYQCSEVAHEYGFKRHTVALFSNLTHIASMSYCLFRNWWYGQYEVKDVFMFQASNFADVSGRWGISFSVWNSPGKTNIVDMISCILKDKKEFQVIDIGVKNIYNSDGRCASKWVRKEIAKSIDAPQMSSGLRVKIGQGCRGNFAKGSLAYMTNVANCVYQSRTNVFWTSSCSSKANGLSITSSNWRHAIALFSARKLVLGDWINDHDEYLIPTLSDTYEQWVDDCHVYVILHPSNNCTSMRDVHYKNKIWTIHNHMFWMKYQNTLEHLDTKDTIALYRDCKAYSSKDVFGNAVESTPDPYMSKVLSGLNLSHEAQIVLDKLNALWLVSLPVRERYAAGKLDLHLTTWDAGVYQLKHLWRDLFPDEWSYLQKAYKTLAEKLKPGVYDHGFLKK